MHPTPPKTTVFTTPAALLLFAAAIATLLPGSPPLHGAEGEAAVRSGPYKAWENGPGGGEDYFPIAVWLQAPRNAAAYKAIGINLYVALWQGPTEEQLAELEKHGMPVICSQNELALRNKGRKIIAGWMHGDEPDNAQELGGGKGYGPPILPEKIIEDFKKISARDATRPVLLNLGQGVAWDGWHGRGVRTNHPEDYASYVQGGDIVSFDIYPVVHDRPAVAGKLWYVPRGVRRLREWTGGKQIVWNCIECTRIGNPDVKPAPGQVKAEVWMSLIQGSTGLIYFCHQFKPRFIEAGLLADEEMARAVGGINLQIRELAPVLNSPTIADGASVETAPAEVSPELAQGLGGPGIAVMVKRHRGDAYIFAVRLEASPVRATLRLKGAPESATAAVLGENRTVEVRGGRFEEDFAPHAVHLYRIR